MPAVFIHGVPDTFHVWDGVRAELARTDVVALALPGFASAEPEGWSATKEEYVAWVVAQLQRLGEPVDLVGHDWGCILVARIASLRPDLVRSWTGGAGPISQGYAWHELARTFQTAGAGEEWMARLEPVSFASRLESLGVPPLLTQATAARMDATMKRCILRLYRSAVHVGAEWEPDLAKVIAPGLVLWGLRDEACPVRFADALAEATHARRVEKLDAGHWFVLERPREVARALEEHWKGRD